MTALKNRDYAYLDDLTYGDLADLSYGIDLGDPVSFTGTMVLGVLGDLSTNFQIVTNVLIDDLVPVTSASGATNPFTPSYIQSGSTVYGNPASIPTLGATGQIQCFVGVAHVDLIGGNKIENIISWNLNLNDQGGTWSANTLIDSFGLGANISMWGLTGLVTKSGYNYSNSSGGYSGGGIFGSRGLNRQLAFLTAGNPNYSANIVNQYLNNPRINQLKTNEDACRFIADLCNVTVQWNIPDYVLTNWQPQASMTGIQAISSLASNVGGILRWNGGTSYKVMFPNDSIGSFQIPDCCLIISAQKDCNLDLASGIHNPGVYLLPTLALFDAGSGTIIPQGGPNSNPNSVSFGGFPTQGITQNNPLQGDPATLQPTQAYHSNTVITSSHATPIVDLPLNASCIYIQNVFKNSTNIAGLGGTTDPSKWVVLQQASLGTNQGGYVLTNVVNGQVKRSLIIDPSFFPPGSNTEVSDNKWYMNVGWSSNPAPISRVTLTATSTLGLTLLKYKFVPMCTGSVTCAFFGSIPVAGMQLSASFAGKNISGIIESVSFSSPGTLTINYVNWGVFEYYQQVGNSSNLGISGFPGV